MTADLETTLVALHDADEPYATCAAFGAVRLHSIGRTTEALAALASARRWAKSRDVQDHLNAITEHITAEQVRTEQEYRDRCDDCPHFEGCRWYQPGSFCESVD